AVSKIVLCCYRLVIAVPGHSAMWGTAMRIFKHRLNINPFSAKTLGGIAMIKLGTIDSEVQTADLDAYLEKVRGQTVQIMGEDKRRGEANEEWVDSKNRPTAR